MDSVFRSNSWRSEAYIVHESGEGLCGVWVFGPICKSVEVLGDSSVVVIFVQVIRRLCTLPQLVALAASAGERCVRQTSVQLYNNSMQLY